MSKSFADRFFLVRLTRDEKKVKTAIVIIGVLLLLLLANTAYLTYLSMQRSVLYPAPSGQPQVRPSIAPLSGSNTALPLPSATSAPMLILPTSAPLIEGTAVKEIFIPFGSGTGQSSDWTNVPGLTAQIDFGKYAHIKEVHFEATVGIPTQNESASVQLFNVTDGHPVWYSPITLTDGQFISSNPLIYDSGPKIYQVQMKTSLGFLVNLYQARIHIILQ